MKNNFFFTKKYEIYWKFTFKIKLKVNIHVEMCTRLSFTN